MAEEFVVAVTLPGTPESFARTCSGCITVGRGEDSVIQLVHPLVSRSHAELSLEDGRFVIRDMDSRNGTVVNDELVRNETRCTEGQAVIQIGPYVLRLTAASILADETFSAPHSDRFTGRVVLDGGMRVLLVDGQPALEGLTGLEYRLLEVLTANHRRLVSNQQIGDALWGAGYWDAYMLHNLVRRVRRKLEEKGLDADELIVSVPGGGYRVT